MFQEINSIRVERFIDFTNDQIFIYPSRELQDEWAKTSMLFQNNKYVFKVRWGKQDFCGNSWYRYWVWVKELPSCTLWIITGKSGTTYEVSFPENTDKDLIVSDLTDFFKKEFDVDVRPFPLTASLQNNI